MDLAKNIFMFDTLAFTKKLKVAGVPEKQAEAQAEAIAEVLNDQMATKHDLNNLKTEMDKEFAAVRSEAKQTELSLKIWMGSIALASVTAAVTILSVVIRIS